MRRWWLSGLSEQLPMMLPLRCAVRTNSIVTLPRGSPTSSVPSMSKLIRSANIALSVCLAPHPSMLQFAYIVIVCAPMFIDVG